MAAPRTKETKMVDLLGDSFEAMRQAVRTESRRGIRFSKRLVAEIDQGRKEVTALARRAARDRTDVAGLYEASIDMARRGFDRSADLVDELLAGARAAGTDVRETTHKVVQANQAAAQAFGTAVRGGLTRAAHAPSKGAAGPKRAAAPVSRRPATSGKKTAGKKPSKTKRAAATPPIA